MIKVKLLFFLAFQFASYAAAAQKEKPTYNTKIDKANKVEIKNGQINIKHADTVFIEVIIANNKEKVFLKGWDQFIDSSGIYITEMYFTNPQTRAYFVDISLTFNQPVLNVDLAYPRGTFSGNHASAMDANPFWFSGSMVAPNGFFITVRSKTKIQVNIKGVDNILN